jgi:hypothetical protein
MEASERRDLLHHIRHLEQELQKCRDLVEEAEQYIRACAIHGDALGRPRHEASALLDKIAVAFD